MIIVVTVVVVLLLILTACMTLSCFIMSSMVCGWSVAKKLRSKK